MRWERASRPARRGFTITELLVALALIIFIMSIIATAFGAASKTVRELRSAADLAERLRGVTALMRQDLSNLHQDGPSRRLSKNWYPSDDPNEDGSNNKGYIRILQYGRPTVLVKDPSTPPDPNNMNIMFLPDRTPVMQEFSNSALESECALMFTTRLPGLLPSEFFTTKLNNLKDNLLVLQQPGQTLNVDSTPASELERRYQPANAGSPNQAIGLEYRQQWAEVAWWLVPTGEFTPSDPDAPAGEGASQTLYTLRRRHRLLFEGNSKNPPVMDWSATPPLAARPSTNPNTDLRNVTTETYRGVSLPTFTSKAQDTNGTDATGFYATTPQTITIPGLRFRAAGMPGNYVDQPMVNGTSPPYPPAPSIAPVPASAKPPVTDSAWAGIPAEIISPPPGRASLVYGGSDQTMDVPDIVLSDVLAFDVRILMAQRYDTTKKIASTDFVFRDLGDPEVQVFNTGNPAYDPTHADHYTKYNLAREQNPPQAKPLYVFDTWTKRKEGALDYSVKTDDPSYLPWERWRRPFSLSALPLYRHHFTDSVTILDPTPDDPKHTKTIKFENYDGPIIQIRAVMITVRLWDAKTNQSRQVSLVQEF